MGYCSWLIWRSFAALSCSIIPYLRTSEQSLITKSGQHLLGSWKNTKDSREKLDANLSVIYITLPFSCAVIHLSALVIDEGRRTSYASLTQVVGGWLPDERGNRWLLGRRSRRAAGHLTDLWLRTSNVSQNSLLDWIRWGMPHAPFCVNHTQTNAWTLTNMIRYYCGSLF